MRLNISNLVLLIFVLAGSSLRAQDVHFSMYHFNRLQINPALTGMFNGDKHVAILHKQQYFSVPVEYLTFTGSYDMKFRRSKDQKGFFSGGGIFTYDRSGDSKLALASLNLMGSYTRQLARGFFGGLGVSLGGGQRSFQNGSNLTWDNQWTGTVFDPSLPSGETFTRTNFFFFDLGAGINFRLQGKDRTKLDFGAGAFHLTRPDFAFYETNDAKLPIRSAFSALGVLKLAEVLDLYANGLYHLQGPYKETVVGGGVIIHLSTRKAREVELHLGVGGRLKDALIPMIALGYDGWKGGFAYDINTSAFDAATNGRGGPEFFLTYTYKKLWPFDQTKVCSIF